MAKSLKETHDIFNENDGNIRGDILHLIIEHLIHEKLFSAANVLEDEINLKFHEFGNRRIKLMKFHKTILNGNWDHCMKMVMSIVPKNRQRSFLYQILRQQYLELIDNGEQERAYSFLMKHIKPLEDISRTQSVSGTEFKELCYLLTCKSVTEADGPLFREWKHFYHQREILADRLLLCLHDILKEECAFYDLSQPTYATSSHENIIQSATELRASRLSSLLKQSYAYQIQQTETPLPTNVSSQLMPSMVPSLEILSLDALKEKGIQSIVDVSPAESPLTQLTGKPLITTLLDDYHPSIYPTTVFSVLSLQSAPITSCENMSAKKLNYLQNLIEPKLTCMAIAHTLDTSHISSAQSVQVISGLDTGEMIEWICYPGCITSKDTHDQECDKQHTFIQTVYSLPGLSSEDMKIYSDTIISSPSFQPDPRPLNRDGYVKRHRKLVVNKKIRDIITTKSTDLNKAPLICLAASDGGINIMKSRNRSITDICSNSKPSNSAANECSWFEHLGRVNAHEGDTYTLAMDPLASYLVSGGFDCCVNIIDLASLSVIRKYKDHQASVTRVGCNRIGNLVFSSSRDGSVKFWDILSGTCIKTLFPHNRVARENDAPPDTNHTEVTSAMLSYDDRYLLTSSRFSPSRLIDLRTGNVVTKYTMKGYSGSTNWFYHSTFGVHDQCVIGGTSPGVTSVWSTQTGQLLYTLQLPPHPISTNNLQSSNPLSGSQPSTTLSQSYLKPSIPSIPCYPLTSPPDVVYSSSNPKRILQYRRSDIVHCYSDRSTGIVGSLTDSNIVLWK